VPLSTPSKLFPKAEPLKSSKETIAPTKKEAFYLIELFVFSSRRAEAGASAGRVEPKALLLKEF